MRSGTGQGMGGILMPLKLSVGNMYDWVSHTHTHLGGECPHHCCYCYVDAPRWGRPAKYQGEIRMVEKELTIDYGQGKTIFIENCHDLFAEDIPSYFIKAIIEHCEKYPDNTYVFQTKNPKRLGIYEADLPDSSIVGCTIETNRPIPSQISQAPRPEKRAEAMFLMKNVRKFITIEPIMDFDLDQFVDILEFTEPDFINIGADSKGHHLPEPPYEKVMELVSKISEKGIEIRKKVNLERLKKGNLAGK